MKNLFRICVLALLLSACGNAPQSSNETSTTNPEGAAAESNDYIGTTAGGCLEGNEVRAGGNVGGAASKRFEIHYLGSSDAKPVVVAKDLTFDANGNFEFKGKLPDGLATNLFETGGDIRVVFDGGESFVSIYSGDCEDSKGQ